MVASAMKMQRMPVLQLSAWMLDDIASGPTVNVSQTGLQA
jgi:hypothetical protein